VLINGRFELLNSPHRIEIFDMRNLKKDDRGKTIPVAVIPLEGPANDRDAGKMALTWLRRSEYLSESEYLNFSDIFLATHPLLARRPKGDAGTHESITK
jgi:hypothetical protein